MASNNRNLPDAVYNFIVYIYLLIMFAVIPLALKSLKYGYLQLGDFKYRLFFVSTVIFLSAYVLLLFIIGISYLFSKKKHALRYNNKPFTVYYAVGAFLITSIITFIISADKKTALYGAPGWNMGFLSTLLFIGIFVAFSLKTHPSNELLTRTVMYTASAATATVFVLGILHRFYFDPLGLYTNLFRLQFRGFLSTIGQPTWYSGFLCMTYPMGLAFFYLEKNNSHRLIAGLYCSIAFCTLVTQNSDSAFLSLFGVLLILLFISITDRERMKRFLDIIILICSVFFITGLLLRLFDGHVYPLDTLSLFAAQGLPARILLVFGILFRIIIANEKLIPQWNRSVAKIVRTIIFIVIGILILMTIGFIILNTNGYLERLFGISVRNNYLFFDNAWGNYRGAIYKRAIEIYQSLPLSRKLFGVGQDSFGLYSFKEYSVMDLLKLVYGNELLCCAHNELLNMLICNGLIGTLAFLSVIVTTLLAGFRRLKEPGGIEYTILQGSVLCIVSYMCHNFFGYANVMVTPYLWVYAGYIVNSCTAGKCLSDHTTSDNNNSAVKIHQ